MFFKVTTLRKQIFILANLFLLGLILLLFNLPGRAIAAPQADLVTVAPGNPIEIATITWWDWGQENQTILDAVALAIDDFGSIKGFNVQQNDYDGACDGGSGTTAANDVIANAQNIGVIGSLCSSSSGAAAAVLETVGVVMISPASTASDVYLNGPTVFNRVVITDPDFEGWNAKISYLPAVLAWQRNFEQIYGYQPGGFGKYAYDATWLLLTRLDEVSSLNGGNLEISRAALAAAVRGTSQTQAANATFAGLTDLITLDVHGDRVNQLAVSGDRYISETGDDSGGNACTEMSTPCASVQRGIALADENAHVFVADGTYVENLTIAISLTLQGGYDPTTWARDLSLHESVIDGSGAATTPGDFDERVRYPWVINDGGTYKMWYTALDLYGKGRVGYATSPDGVNWTRSGDNPVLDLGDWDAAVIEGVSVIKEGPNTYKMWYSDTAACAFGYATSPDGLNWTKYAGNPVLTTGPDDWNNECILHPFVLSEGGIYKMWFYAAGDAGSGPVPHMAYATSPDGINWTFVKDLFGRTWEAWFWRPAIRNTGSGYQMWHSLFDGEVRTSYATATTETNWSKHGSPVLSGNGGAWDEGNAANPFVLYEAGNYTLWYDNNFAIGLATSANGIDWTKPYTQPVFTGGDASQYGLPVVYFQPDSAGAVLDGFTITGGDVGEQGGGITIEGAAPSIRSCRITGNHAYGNNEWGGGGMLIAGDADPEIWDSVITGNTAAGGASAIRVGEANFTLVNSLVAGNSGRPAIHGNDASLTLINVTVADNGLDGGLWLNNTAGTVVNSILWEAQGQDIGVDGSGSYTITYSNVEDALLPGIGNLNADPLFVDAANGDFRLKPGSPSIDAGTNSSAPDHDLAGNARPFDGDRNGIAVSDMGAYEAYLKWVFLPLILR